MPLQRILTSPIGPLLLTVTHGAITGLTMGSPVHALPPNFSTHPSNHVDVRTADAAQTQLAEYFAAARTRFDLPLSPHGTPFQQRIWAALKPIPYGQTQSYLDIAKVIDPARAANLSRAVGQANGANPIGIIVPCHRVIAASGKLSGYAGGATAKQWLLDHERQTAGVISPRPETRFCCS